ncbi:MAG: hypothetical protein WB523_14355 [Candidatus Sulfotelmatobacter sp.]
MKLSLGEGVASSFLVDGGDDNVPQADLNEAALRGTHSRVC